MYKNDQNIPNIVVDEVGMMFRARLVRHFESTPSRMYFCSPEQFLEGKDIDVKRLGLFKTHAEAFDAAKRELVPYIESARRRQ